MLSSKNSSYYSVNLICKTRHLLHKARQRELAPYNITPQQAHILLILHELGHKVTLTELARHVERESNSLSEQVAKMEKDGLVKKTRETPKSNKLSCVLTKKGLEICNQSQKLRVDKAIMSVVSLKERQQLMATLEKLIHEAEKYQ